MYDSFLMAPQSNARVQQNDINNDERRITSPELPKSETIKHLNNLIRCRNQRTGSFCRKTCDRFSPTTIKKKKRIHKLKSLTI